ncbi:DUF1080 domain-containing protein [Cohnella endophytica]|uniref:DUF1080 domain-containing protein n=1 Tax=Cohnella endophytica TaxID=2419778 RepID=A0A494Y2P6_9BACL|nr:glycosyl hydrolase family 98 C-terminal domain-containing protein [Cohnella endophytica]RKP56270.1 DUF1080 domain-containing protein [Cohnella endophytica]
MFRKSSNLLSKRFKVTVCLLLMVFASLGSIGGLQPKQAHGAGAMRRVVDNAHPMLIMQLLVGSNYTGDPDFRRDNNRQWDIKQAWAGLPDDIKPYVVFVLHPGHFANWVGKPSVANSRKWIEDNLAEGKDLNIPMMVLYGENPTSGSDGMTWLESLYQNYPNMIGTDVSELTSVNSSIPGLLALANTYGGYHIQGSMEDNNVFANAMKTQSYYNSIAQYSANFIPNFKMIHKNYDYVNSEALGYWMAGAAGNWGPYYDSYPFPASNIFGQSSNGGGDRTTRAVPETLYSMSMLDSYLHGATVYQLENQLDLPAVNNLYTPLFYESILPAFRYIVAHPAPTKAQVIAKTKVAFDASAGTMPELSDSRTWGGVQNQTSLFQGLYEMAPDTNSTSGLWYWLRTTGRYGMIPQIPQYAPSSVLAQFSTILNLTTYNANYTSQATRTAFFNTKYPSVYTGTAFAEKNDNNWLIYNNHYSANTNETATLPLTGGTTFSQLDFTTITPHTYATVDDTGSTLDIQINNYRSDHQQDIYVPAGKRMLEFTDYYAEYSYVPHPFDTTLRSTVFTVTATSKPVIAISGYDGHYNYTDSWNSSTMVDTITVNHNGPVRLILKTTAGDDTAFWTRADDTDSLISYTGTWTNAGTANDYNSTYKTTSTVGATASYEFFGTSVAWVDRKGSTGGTADVYIDGTLDASNVSTNSSITSYGQVVYSKTGLTNQFHTIKIVAKSAIIGIDRISFIPAAYQMLNDISFNDFSYGTAVEDEDTNLGSKHWTVKNGQMKIIPYDSPWVSDVPIYMKKKTYSGNFTYEIKVNSVVGTPVRILFDTNPSTRQGYSLMLDPLNKNVNNDGTQALKLYKDQSTLLATSSVSLAANHQYAVKIIVTGSTIQCYLDGTLYITATDTSYTSGMVGVKTEVNYGSASQEYVLVDDAKVTVGSTVDYTTDFGSWSAATDWVGEGAIAFTYWPTRTSFDFPYQWTTTGGTWAVLNDDTKYTNGTNGVYNVTAVSGAENFSTAGSTSWANYIYKAMMKFKTGTIYDAGLLFRVTDTNNMYKVGVTTNGTTGTISLLKRVSGTWSTIATTSQTISTEKWYSFSVEANADSFKVSLNGNVVLSARDNTFAAGAVGLSANNGTKVQFDDAWIARLAASTQTTSPPTSVTVDDRDPSIIYSGTWGQSTSSLDYLTTESWSKVAGAYAQFTFTGTKIEYLSMKQKNMGFVDVYVDGVLEAANIDCYAATNTKQVILFTKSGMTAGSHTIKIVVDGTKNAASSDVVGALDAFTYYS